MKDLYLFSIFFEKLKLFTGNFKQSSPFISKNFFSCKDAAFFKYNFLLSLKMKDYPKYLKIAYYAKTGKKINLMNPKNLNEYIQYLKIYDNIPIKSELTDKIKVREYVKNLIGEKYLKPMLWAGKYWDNIPFDMLPNSFIIKANHGCKWQVIVKNKDEFVKNERLFKYCKAQFDGYMKQTFFGFSDFETQYLNIKPQIIIEPLLRENIDEKTKEYWVWCTDSIQCTEDFDEKFKEEAIRLSKILSDKFKFVRVDWMVYNDNLYFGEMTFTPFSGFIPDEMLNQTVFKQLSENLKLK